MANPFLVLDLPSVKAFQSALSKATKEEAEEVLLPALQDEIAVIQGIAVQKAPRDTGQLRRNTAAIPTAFSSWSSVAGRPVAAEIQTGFVFLQKYAAVQHERLDYHHEDGEAKYVEKAMAERRTAFVERLASASRGFLGR